MTLSLCMIVKDEAATLATCLEAVQGVVDEMIVVDTGSTDGTVALAESYGARVYTFDWVNDFAAARNYSLRRTTGDWVLVLDADEVLQPAGVALLQGLKDGQPLGEVSPEAVLAVNLLRLELGAPQAPYTLITRIFRRLPEILFERPYHETVDDSLARLQGQDPRWQVVTLEQIALHHTGYGAEVVAQRQKFERARTLMEPYLEQHPQDSYLLNKLAALYIEEDQSNQALPLLNQALERAEAIDPITRYELYYHRALAQKQAQPDQAAADYEQALDQSVPAMLKLGAWINYGSLKQAQGDAAAAIHLFQQAIDTDPSLALAHYNLGLAHRTRGYLDEAIAAYQRAIELQPDYPEAHQNLGVALFKLGKLPESLAAFSRAVKIYQRTDPAYAVSLKQRLKSLGLPDAMLAQAHLSS